MNLSEIEVKHGRPIAKTCLSSFGPAKLHPVQISNGLAKTYQRVHKRVKKIKVKFDE
jgi:hypothetical protein